MAIPECPSYLTKVYTLLLNVKEEIPSHDLAEITLSIQKLILEVNPNQEIHGNVMDDIYQPPLDLSRQGTDKIVDDIIAEFANWHNRYRNNAIARSASLAELVATLQEIDEKGSTVDDTYPSLAGIISSVRKISETGDNVRSWTASYYFTCIEMNMDQTRKKFDERNISLASLQALIKKQIPLERMETVHHLRRLTGLIIRHKAKQGVPDIIRRLTSVSDDCVRMVKHHNGKLAEIANMMADHQTQTNSNFADRELVLTAVMKLLRENIACIGHMTYIFFLLEVSGSQVADKYPFLLDKRDVIAVETFYKFLTQFLAEADGGICGREIAVEICGGARDELDDWRGRRDGKLKIVDLMLQACVCIRDARELHKIACVSCGQ